jgi:hypothetical protein
MRCDGKPGRRQIMKENRTEQTKVARGIGRASFCLRGLCHAHATQGGNRLNCGREVMTRHNNPHAMLIAWGIELEQPDSLALLV